MLFVSLRGTGWKALCVFMRVMTRLRKGKRNVPSSEGTGALACSCLVLSFKCFLCSRNLFIRILQNNSLTVICFFYAYMNIRITCTTMFDASTMMNRFSNNMIYVSINKKLSSMNMFRSSTNMFRPSTYMFWFRLNMKSSSFNMNYVKLYMKRQSINMRKFKLKRYNYAHKSKPHCNKPFILNLKQPV